MVEQKKTVENLIDLSSELRPTVMKFGGTSVGGARPIQRVVRIVESHHREGLPLIVVVSAVRGVTDKLVKICENLATKQVNESLLICEDILGKHSSIVGELDLPRPLRDQTDDEILELITILERQVRLVNPLTSSRQDLILSIGERLNARIVRSKLLAKGVTAEAVDAMEFLQTDNNYGQAEVDFPATTRFAHDLFFPKLDQGIIPVVTGFIGATKDNKVTTLGRQGSDYTATILARVLNAKEVWIWKDVDGVFTEDPRTHPEAELIPELTFFTANRVTRISEQMLFPSTLQPLEGTDIVLRIKNTFKPEAEGTKIWHG